MLKNKIFLLVILTFLSSTTFLHAQRSTTAEITVTSSPSGATVQMGRRSYTTPFKIALRPRMEYEFAFSKSGYKSKTVKHMGGTGNLHVTLEPDKSRLTIESNVNSADIFINNTQYGRTNLTIELDPGRYSVRVSKPGYTTYNTTINLNGNQRVYAQLEQINYITLKIPVGARVFVNNASQKYNASNKRDRFVTLQLYAPEGQKGANVKVQYHNLEINEYINFNKQKIKVDLRFN